MDQLVPIGQCTPEDKRLLGTLIGDVLQERRYELRFSRKELSEYLASYWSMHWSSVTEIISGLEGGGGIATDLMQYPTEKYMGTYQRRLSDLNAALEMPRDRRRIINRAMCTINTRFSYIPTKVEPYSLHENAERVHGRTHAGIPKIHFPVAYKGLKKTLEVT